MKHSHYLIFIVLMVSSCATPNQYLKNRQNLDRIVVGQNEEVVKQVMGYPAFILPLRNGKVVYFYQTGPKNEGESLAIKNCTPILINDARVAGVGIDFLNQLTMIPAPQNIAPDRKEKENGLKVAEKIKALEAKVGPIPASNYKMNLELYKELLDLSPDNEKFKKKVNYYQSKLDQRKKQRRNRVSIDSEKTEIVPNNSETIITSTNYKIYGGNDKVQLALHKLSTGTLYVWIKNTGDAPFSIEPKHNTLLDKNDNKIECEFAKGLMKTLSKGEIAHGRVKYPKKAELGKIVFDHRHTGKVIRVISE